MNAEVLEVCSSNSTTILPDKVRLRLVLLREESYMKCINFGKNNEHIYQNSIDLIQDYYP